MFNCSASVSKEKDLPMVAWLSFVEAVTLACCWRWRIRAQLSKFSTHIKTRASLWSKFVMAVDFCIGIVVFELSDKCLQGFFLLGCPRVFGLAEAVEAADIADADGVGIVSLAVSAAFGYGPTCMDVAIEVNHEVIANASEPALAVPTVDVGNGEGLAFRRCAAMNDDFGDGSHNGLTFGQLDIWIIGQHDS